MVLQFGSVMKISSGNFYPFSNSPSCKITQNLINSFAYPLQQNNSTKHTWLGAVGKPVAGQLSLSLPLCGKWAICRTHKTKLALPNIAPQHQFLTLFVAVSQWLCLDLCNWLYNHSTIFEYSISALHAIEIEYLCLIWWKYFDNLIKQWTMNFLIFIYINFGYSLLFK